MIHSLTFFKKFDIIESSEEQVESSFLFLDIIIQSLEESIYITFVQVHHVFVYVRPINNNNLVKMLPLIYHLITLHSTQIITLSICI